MRHVAGGVKAGLASPCNPRRVSIASDVSVQRLMERRKQALDICFGVVAMECDPQATGVPPLDPVADDPASERTVEVANEFLTQARQILSGQPKANRSRGAIHGV